MITPNEDQSRALEAIRDWIKSGDQCFSLGGLAGTGKSTIIPLIYEEYHQQIPIGIGTPTGKASSVVNKKFADQFGDRKGNHIAKTIHQLAYAPIGNQKTDRKDFLGRQEYEPVFEESQYSSPLTLIDETSMVSDDVYGHLLSMADNRYLFIGDHGQLPPVQKRKGISRTLENRDYTLTQIVRQAEGSPIRKLAYNVRMGGSLSDPQPGIDVVNFRRLQDVAVMAKERNLDMLICATNRTRNALNMSLRALSGFAGEPMICVGEKVIITSNNHNMEVFNGETYTVTAVHRRAKHDEGPTMLVDLFDGDRVISRINLGFQFRTHVCYEDGFTGVDLGYCLTCHKAQGSQADRVGVIAENIGWMGDLAPAHRYTGATRASEELTIFTM